MNTPTQKSPLVSAIIPTKNRPIDLECAVKSVLSQSDLPLELLIVDQSSGDESRQRVEAAFAAAPASIRSAVKLIYVYDPEISGLAVARNRGMELSQGDVWLFLDDDVVLETAFIKELLAVYDNYPGVTGVSGIVTNYRPYPLLFGLWSAIFVRGPFADTRQVVYQRADRLRNSDPVRIDRFTGALMSFRAEAIRGLRFDDNLRGVSDGEDVDFCARLGPRAILMLAPRARLVHNQSPAGREQSHWLRRDSRSQHYLYRRNWNHGFKNRVCLFWLNAGYALVATVASLRRISGEPWRALNAGIREAGVITPPANGVLQSKDHRQVSDLPPLS